MHDEDLLEVASPVPEESNAFTYLQRAQKELHWPDAKKDPRVKASLGEKNWDSAFVRDLIGKNIAFFLLIDNALASRHFQVPEYNLPTIELHGAPTWIKFSKLLRWYALVKLEQGKQNSTFETLLKILQLGHKVEGAANGVLIHSFIGKGIKTVALKELSEILSHTKLTSSESNRLSHTLQQFYTDPQQWAEMTKAEYRITRGILIEAYLPGIQHAALLSANSIHETTWWNDPEWYFHFLLKDYLFHPNETLELHAEVMRDIGQRARNPCSKKTSLDITNQQSPMGAWVAPNGFGQVLAEMVKANFQKYEVRRCVEDTRNSATQILIGLKAYQDTHDHLPDTLEALVPDFLDAIPQDFFGGPPMRYSKKTRIVYSVGEDFRDEGGRIGGTTLDRSEPTWAITF